MKTEPRLGIGLMLLSLCSVAAVADDSNPAATDDSRPNVIYLPGDAGERNPQHTVVPDYPELARRERVEGEVEVCFNVDRDGTTHNVRVRRSTNRIFEKPALRAVRASTFAPLPDAVQLSGIKTCRTFRFSLTPVAIEDSD
jgi:TonB family protein